MAVEILNWFEIPVSDLNRAKKFYEEIFGKELPPLDVDGETFYCFPGKDGEGYDGALVKYEFKLPGTEGPMIYFNSDDIEATLNTIENSGGKIFKAKTEIAPGYGYYAYFIDTEGNLLALQGMN